MGTKAYLGNAHLKTFIAMAASPDISDQVPKSKSKNVNLTIIEKGSGVSSVNKPWIITPTFGHCWLRALPFGHIQAVCVKRIHPGFLLHPSLYNG